MPKATVNATATFARVGGMGRATVTLRNPGSSIAFFIRLQVTGKNGEEALPVTWDDNYITLLPGEKRVLTASYRTRDLGGGMPHLVFNGWNVARRTVPATSR
jgi:exo-1,4-beta-D-glucosaminidase